MVLNFVTEIGSNFLALKIMFWILNFVTEICNIFPCVESNVLDFEFCTRVENNVLY